MVMEKDVACETHDLFCLAPQELALYPTLSAHDIQASLLPAGVPRIEDWTFVASLEPACHFSGDLYDFISLPGGRWGVLVADVADKGMPAALYMALFRMLVRDHAPGYADDPAACLQAVNDQLLAETRADLFVTAFYGILDPATGEMRFSNAGHNPPYLCHRDGAPPGALRTAGMALGIMPHVQLGHAGVRLAPGDYVVLYTDGLTEAHDQAFNEFGKARLLAEIVRWDGAPVETIHHFVRVAVRKFVGDAPQSDDLTLVVIGRSRRSARCQIFNTGLFEVTK
jgi:sigma-B regulation protein RsbU (phosphoserine phosphatase)